MISAVKYLHLLSLIVWIGSMIFFSFIGAPAIFKTLDRHTAGDVVGVIFPKYYLVGYSCSLLALATLAYLGSRTGFTPPVKGGIVVLALMTGAVFYSGMVTAPKVNEVKYQIRAETDEAKAAALRKSFGKLHGISMIQNVVTLVLGLALIYFTTRYLPSG